MSSEFPPGFVWGAATASYQIEGAVDEDGRGQSCWDVFVRTSGAVHHGDTGDVACDSYHRLAEDLAAEIAAAKTYLYLLPILEGSYPEVKTPGLVPQAPVVQDGDMETIQAPIDFMGVNYYDPIYVRRRREALGRGEEPIEGYANAVVVKPDGFPRTSLGWVVDPASFYQLLMLMSRRAPRLPIYVTENGCASYDYPGPDGEVHDPERIEYLATHIKAMKRAIDDGADVRGYFVWSLLDNFEWTDGYSQRLGLAYVDYATQRRTLKSGARFYAEVIAGNALPPPRGLNDPTRGDQRNFGLAWADNAI